MYRIRAPESCDIVRLHLAAALSAGSQCTAFHCTALHCTAFHCTALHCTALHRCFGCRRLTASARGCCGMARHSWHGIHSPSAFARCDRSKPKPLEYLKSVLDIKQKYAYLVDHALGKNTRSVHRPVPTRQHRWL